MGKQEGNKCETSMRKFKEHLTSGLFGLFGVVDRASALQIRFDRIGFRFSRIRFGFDQVGLGSEHVQLLLNLLDRVQVEFLLRWLVGVVHNRLKGKASGKFDVDGAGE